MDALMDVYVSEEGGAEEEDLDTYEVCGIRPPTYDEIWNQVVQSPEAVWRRTLDCWGETAARIPESLPAIPAPPDGEALADKFERLRSWVWTYIQDPLSWTFRWRRADQHFLGTAIESDLPPTYLFWDKRPKAARRKAGARVHDQDESPDATGKNSGAGLGEDGADIVRKIIHVDMDSYYASVEQRDNPELRGRPVAVGSAEARGVVAAASYEARAFGVRSAMASVTAMRRCPNLVFVRPRFEVYRAVSAEIRAIFAEHTDLVEPLSLDEAYLDITQNKQSIPLATDVAKTIRAKIRETTHLTASAGISYNKFLAKMASDLRKPDGQAVIPPEKGAAFVATLAVSRFHGVGPATAAKMERLGIRSGADLREKSLEFLQEHFGKSGAWYYGIARGRDDRPVQPNRPRKSVGAEDTFSEDLFDAEAARREVSPLAAKIWKHCAARGVVGRTITLKVKYSDFRQITRSRTVDAAVSSAADLEAIARCLLDPLFPTRLGIRLLGVTLSSLEQRSEGDEGRGQITLWETGLLE